MNDSSDLSASEHAYFESRGEADPSPGASVSEIPAQAEIQTPVGGPAGRRERSVPYAALAQERARRKELQRQIENMRAGANGRVGESANRQDGPTPNGDAPDGAPGDRAPDERQPAAEGDPDQGDGFDPALSDTLEHARKSNIGQNYVSAVRALETTHPDFLDAYKHVVMDRANELLALGYLPSEAVRITTQNEVEIVERALAQGRNPAELIYNLAIRRGYNPPGARTRPAAPSQAERIALAARGQAGSKSLSDAGGGGAASVSLEALAQLSDDEFAAATQGDRWERLMR